MDRGSEKGEHMASPRRFWLVLAVMGLVGGVTPALRADVPAPENVRGYYHSVGGGEAQVILFWSNPMGYSEIVVTRLVDGQEPYEFSIGSIHSISESIDASDASKVRYELRGIFLSESSPSVFCVPENGNLAAPQDVTCSYSPGVGTTITWTNPVIYDHVNITRVIQDELGLRGDGFGVEGTATQALDPRVLSTTEHVYFEVQGWQHWDKVPNIFLTSQPVGCWLVEQPHLPFIRGDVNRDGVVSISDVATLSDFLFKGGPWLPCWSAADTNDDGKISSPDMFFILFALFQTGGPVFPEPFPLGAVDDKPGSLACADSVGPAPARDDRFVLEVGSVVGMPGEIVTVPVFATTPVTVDAESLSLTYDASLVKLEDATVEGTVLEPPVPPGMPIVYLKNDAAAGKAVIGIHNNFLSGSGNLPPLDRKVILNLKVRILPEAAEGSTEIVPEDGLGDPPVSNEFSVLGSAVYAATLPVLKRGKIGIGAPGNIDFFLRGDPNADGRRDIADPIALIAFLFTGGSNLSCGRAGDANDDGSLDLTDAVTMLSYLFLGAPGDLPPPYPSCGWAPISGLSCESGGCR
jgi:dockerin type I repeat protein/cohesin domain-containing protein